MMVRELHGCSKDHGVAMLQDDCAWHGHIACGQF